MVYFISGHRDLTQEEFNKYYKPEIDYILLTSPHTPVFIVADCEGADRMAQDYLATLVNKCTVEVYHIGDKPEYLASNKFDTIGKFNSHVERDSCMTSRSNTDIAFIRDPNKDTGTRQNVIRRHIMK